jgi:fatty acid desaturase
MENVGIKYGGLGFFQLLTILFIGLKLGNVITWGWLWILSPLWIPILISLTLFILIVMVLFIIELFNHGYSKRLNKKWKEKEITDAYFSTMKKRKD